MIYTSIPYSRAGQADQILRSRLLACLVYLALLLPLEVLFLSLAHRVYFYSDLHGTLRLLAFLPFLILGFLFTDTLMWRYHPAERLAGYLFNQVSVEEILGWPDVIHDYITFLYATGRIDAALEDRFTLHIHLFTPFLSLISIEPKILVVAKKNYAVRDILNTDRLVDRLLQGRSLARAHLFFHDQIPANLNDMRLRMSLEPNRFALDFDFRKAGALPSGHELLSLHERFGDLLDS